MDGGVGLLSLTEVSRDYVLDSSALLAVFHREPGADQVLPLLPRSAISSVNWAEVFQKMIQGKLNTRTLRQNTDGMGVHILPFTAADAEQAALLWEDGRRKGLSLGDRACLSLALRLNLPVVTADRVWATLDLGIDVRTIR